MSALDVLARTKWVPASRANYTVSAGTRHVDHVVIHTMETPERIGIAESIARNWFGDPKARVSAHFCIDASTIVQGVRINDVAWAAPGVNSTGVQLELAGRAQQSRAEWMDPFSIGDLVNAACVAAAICKRFNIPVARPTVTELARGARGIVGHADASAAFKRSDHGDPGPSFPWREFLALVAAGVAQITDETARKAFR